MKGSKYLSELVDVSRLRRNKLNIITAPTGCGKTYFALHHIPNLVDNAHLRVVYLIDTVNGKEQILDHYNAIREYYGWTEVVSGKAINVDNENRPVVLTYARFGMLLEEYPEFYNEFSYIICDELPSLIWFQGFEPKPNSHSVALEGLKKAVRYSRATVIALTATPNSLFRYFYGLTAEIPIDQSELIQYAIQSVVQYNNLDDVLCQVSTDHVGLCYVSRISQMIDFCQKAQQQGFSPIAIWSVNNTEHPMTEEQLSARESILRNYTIPPQYNLLIINSSSETSIKIKSHVDYVVVHSTNSDTQIQVRGRVNNDLDTLFLPGKSAPIIKVPDDYLGKKLFHTEKNKLIQELNIRNQNNRPCGWTSIKKYLVDNDYSITDGRQSDKRYNIITHSQ